MIDVVILNWNKRRALMSALESLFNQSIAEYRVIVVDNGSTDGSATAVKAAFGERVTLLALSDNRGGTAGFNAGLAVACDRENEAIFLMDNDVILERSALEILLAELRARPSAAAVGPKIFYNSDPERIWCCGGVWRPFLAETTHRGGNCLDTKKYHEPKSVRYLPTCALLVRRSAINKVGLMDDRFFIYNDDVEWCLRFHCAGWEVRMQPAAIAWHDVSYKSSTLNPMIVYYSVRNQGLLLQLHATRIQKIGAALLLPFSLLKRELIFCIEARSGGFTRWIELNRAAWRGLRDWSAGRFGRDSYTE